MSGAVRYATPTPSPAAPASRTCDVNVNTRSHHILFNQLARDHARGFSRRKLTCDPEVLDRELDAVLERPVHYGAGRDGRAWVASAGRTSFTVGHELRHEVSCVRAEAVVVRPDPSTQRSRPPEGPMLTALEERAHVPSVGARRSASGESGDRL